MCSILYKECCGFTKSSRAAHSTLCIEYYTFARTTQVLSSTVTWQWIWSSYNPSRKEETSVLLRVSDIHCKADSTKWWFEITKGWVFIHIDTRLFYGRLTMNTFLCSLKCAEKLTHWDEAFYVQANIIIGRGWLSDIYSSFTTALPVKYMPMLSPMIYLYSRPDLRVALCKMLGIKVNVNHFNYWRNTVLHSSCGNNNPNVK